MNLNYYLAQQQLGLYKIGVSHYHFTNKILTENNPKHVISSKSKHSQPINVMYRAEKMYNAHI